MMYHFANDVATTRFQTNRRFGAAKIGKQNAGRCEGCMIAQINFKRGRRRTGSTA